MIKPLKFLLPMTAKSNFLLALPTLILSLFSPYLASAQPKDPGLTTGFSDSPEGIITSILQVGLSLIAIISIAAIVYGAFSYVVSLGDDQKVAKAKKVILYALVGLLIALAAGTIVSFIFTELEI